MTDTIRTRREKLVKTNRMAKQELFAEVEREVEDFRNWLIETKNLETTTAHYYSVSLKSLLLGIPVGVQVAQLFDTILEKMQMWLPRAQINSVIFATS